MSYLSHILSLWSHSISTGAISHKPSAIILTDMADSKNQGFTVLDKDAVHCKVRFCGEILDWTLGEETKIPEALQKVMETVCKDYTYLLR